MNKYLSGFLLAGIAIIINSSCTNDDIPGSDSVRMVKHSQFTLDTPPDLILDHVFTYDASGRVIKIAEENANQPEDLTLTYTGASTNPTTATYGTTQHYFTYDNAGKLLTDSFREPGFGVIGIVVKNFEYLSNNRVVMYSVGYDEGQTDFHYRIDSIQLDQNGNAITQTYYMQSNTTGNLYKAFKLTNTFDNKINPFGELNIANLLVLGFDDIYFTEQKNRFFGKNNCVAQYMQSFDEAGNQWDDDNWTAACIYLNNGYISEKTTSGGGPFNYRQVFTYQ